MPITYVSERPQHAADIEGVLDRAFGPGRFAKTSERVRENGAVHRLDLSRVAEERAVPKPVPLVSGVPTNLARVLGVCRIYDIHAGAPALLLGPLAVDPEQQHHGLGAQLVRESLAASRSVGAACIICVGAAAFFEPLGFSLIPKGQVHLPGPVDARRFLWIALRPGGTDNIAGMVGPPV